MEYSKIYFMRYLAADEQSRKASKNHWLKIHSASVLNGDCESDTFRLSASILAAISVADNMIEKKLVISA